MSKEKFVKCLHEFTTSRVAALLTVAVWVWVAPAVIRAGSNEDKAFEALKALKGDWVAKMPDGNSATTSFRLSAAGSVVVQMIGEGTDMEMPTMFHLDGDRLLATHYCAAKNQPRMVLEPGQDAAKKLKFRFLDVTNLPNADAGHMRQVSFEFIDQDHLRQEWTYREKGKDTPEVFDLVRKR